MKLMIVIVQEQDFPKLSALLIRNRILATKFLSEGLYLNKRNVTLFICIDEEREEELLGYIRESCTEREEQCEVWEYNGHVMEQTEKTLKIGGATIFVSEIDKILKY